MTVLGNVEGEPVGHRATRGKPPGCGTTYLAAFAYRLNRRLDLRGLIARLIMRYRRYLMPILRHVILRLNSLPSGTARNRAMLTAPSPHGLKYPGEHQYGLLSTAGGHVDLKQLLSVSRWIVDSLSR